MTQVVSETMKLQAFLARAGVAARRKAETLITEGKVLVNGTVATLGQRVDPVKDIIEINGKTISLLHERDVYLIYKPVGIVSTTSDELGRKTVINFLAEHLPSNQPLPRLYPVGRLDVDSEGLMIITNDGTLAQSLTHPSYEVEKTYRITVIGHPTEKALLHLEKGVLLKEGMTAPAKVTVVSESSSETVLDITIHEGRYHQVKRMLRRVGYEVFRLIRIRMGQYSLADLHDQPVQKVSAPAHL